MVKKIRKIEKILGKKKKLLPQMKKKTKLLVRQSLHAIDNIIKGEKFTHKNIALMRPTGGAPPSKLKNFIGKIAKKNISSMSKLSKKIIFITSSRAEFGQFSSFLKKLSSQKNVNLKLVVSGSHLFKKFGNSYEDIKNSGISITKLIKINEFQDVHLNKIPVIYSKIIKEFQKFLLNYKPDFIIIPCDRYEMLIFTLTAFIMKIPVIHFYGGEISKGAIDNVIRNQISLMSKYHFVSNLDHKKNLY